MEPVLMMNKNADYNRRIINPKRNFITNRSLSSYPYDVLSDDLLLASLIAGGHFAGNSLSFPANFSVLPPPHHRQLPPLLPLPINHPNMNIYRSNSSFNANIRSSPPRNNKNVKNRVRDHSLTPKKSKNQKKNLKREEADLDLDLDLVTPAVTEVKEASATAPEKPVTELKMNLGPDPKDLPKDVISRGFSSSMNKSSSDIVVSVNVDKFSGSVVFTPSPPPSSLPLPTFSLRPKLSCKSEAVSGVDAGATDNLRRLLRL